MVRACHSITATMLSGMFDTVLPTAAQAPVPPAAASVACCALLLHVGSG